MDFKIVRGEMAKLEPRWATGTFLGRTDESDEVIRGYGNRDRIRFARFGAAQGTNSGSVMHSRHS